MNWFHAVALAALLALAPVTAVAPTAPAAPASGPSAAVSPTGSTAAPTATRAANAAATPVVVQENTPEYLALPDDDIVKVRFDAATVDVSGAVAADSGSLEGEFDRRWVEAAVNGADNQAERRAALRAAADRLENRTDALHARERAALRAYNAGDISTGAYLRTLAAIDAEARALEGAVDRLENYARSFSDRPVSRDRIGRIYERARSLQGPVRERVGQSLTGEAEPLRVYVETSTEGVVLTTIVGSDDQKQYLREAYLPSARDPAADNAYGEDFEAVLERLSDLYPWAMENRGGMAIGRGVGPPSMHRVGVYQFTIFHPQGQLTAYFDGGTNTTFLEYQRLDLAQVPTGSPTATTSEDLRLQVNRTRVGGPLLVQVTDNSTGSPVDATVTINGERIGTTGPDGRVWAVTPQGRFTVNATSGGREVGMQTFSLRPDQSGES